MDSGKITTRAHLRALLNVADPQKEGKQGNYPRNKMGGGAF
jgi:hypothetical protein